MTELNELTIIIPVKIDSDDRLSNLDIVVNYLQSNVTSNIIVCEQDIEPKLEGRYTCKYMYIKMGNNFNKSKSINTAAKVTKTPVLAVYDTDAIVTVGQLVKATKVILDKHAHVVYPYDGKFYDVPKKYHNILKETGDLNAVNLDECKLFNNNSVGGAVLFDTDVFLRYGGANEKFEGWGYEDNELYVRFQKVGCLIGRTTRPLLHLTHERVKPVFYDRNLEEKNRQVMEIIHKMTQEQLIEEINSWSWR